MRMRRLGKEQKAWIKNESTGETGGLILSNHTNTKNAFNTLNLLDGLLRSRLIQIQHRYRKLAFTAIDQIRNVNIFLGDGSSKATQRIGNIFMQDQNMIGML